MKKFFIMNASPKGRGSDTLKLTEAFIDGLRLVNENIVVDYAHLAELSINPCCACHACIHTTSGICHYVDDMTPLLSKYSQADYVIISFPLHNSGMGSYYELFNERLLPLVDFSQGHDRNDLVVINREFKRPTNERFIFISTCGSTNIKEAYQLVEQRIDYTFNNEATKLLFPTIKYAAINDQKRGLSFLKTIQWAGQDFAKYGHITPEIDNILNRYRESTEELTMLTHHLAQHYLGIDNKQKKLNLVGLGKINQMMKTYNCNGSTIERKILQLQFTDLNEMYQLHLTPLTFTVTPKGVDKYDALIETTYETWNNLMLGKTDISTTLKNNELSYIGQPTILQLIDNGLFFNPTKKITELSLFLSFERSHDWINKRINSGAILLLPWVICSIFLYKFTFLALVFGLIASVIIMISKRVTDVTLMDKSNLILFLGLLLWYGVNFSFNEVNPYNLYVLLLIILSLVCCVSLFTNVPLSSYLLFNHHFNTISNLTSFKQKHRLMTKFLAVYFMGIPLIAITAFILRLPHLKLGLIVISLIFIILMRWFSLNFEKYFYTATDNEI